MSYDVEKPVEEKEEKKRTLCSVLGDALAITFYLGSKGVNGAVKGVKTAKDMVTEYGPDVKRGYQIGADVGNFLGYLDPVGTIKDVFEGNEPMPKDMPEDSSIGVKCAEEYKHRRDSLPHEDQGPVTVATWGVGFWPGVLAYLITWPFKALYSLLSTKRCKRKKEEASSGLEERVESS